MELEHDLCFMYDYLNTSITGRIKINRNNTIIELGRKERMNGSLRKRMFLKE